MLSHHPKKPEKHHLGKEKEWKELKSGKETLL